MRNIIHTRTGSIISDTDLTMEYLYVGDDVLEEALKMNLQKDLENSEV